jgi:hypothetical protein
MEISKIYSMPEVMEIECLAIECHLEILIPGSPTQFCLPGFDCAYGRSKVLISDSEAD